jgi:uncharacterized protein (DUF1015 family)
MAIIKPFKGIRPAKDKVHLVASRSLEEYTTPQLSAKLSDNPYSFLHILKPEFKETAKAKTGTPEQVLKTKEKFLQFLEEGVLFQDQEECLYFYQQVQHAHSFTGIIACTSIWDYYSNAIKIHEQTISEREEKLKSYYDICNFNTEPVCLCYPDNHVVDDILKNITATIPEYDFSTTDKVEHKLWSIKDKQVIANVLLAFEKIPSLYIADGHHRTAASSLLGKTKKKSNPHHTGNEPYNFFLSVIFPERDLKILEFNRIVKDLNFLSKDMFLRKLSKQFNVAELTSPPYKPEKKGKIHLYVEQRWYALSLKEGVKNHEDFQKKLDVEILSDLILSPLLDIQDLKTDKRITFLSGTKDISELTKMIDDGKAMAGFVLHPLTMRDIIQVADAKATMPPKSTWVEPKMRNGLVVYSTTSPI